MVKSTYCEYFIDIQDISSPTRLLYLPTWFTWQKVANLKYCLSFFFLYKSIVNQFSWMPWKLWQQYIVLNFIWVASAPSKLEPILCSWDKTALWKVSKLTNVHSLWQYFFLCIERRTILNSSMSGRKAKQVKRVIKYRPVSDHEMNVSTVHVNTKFSVLHF